MRRPLVALVAVAALSACGSTVPLNQQEASTVTDGLGGSTGATTGGTASGGLVCGVGCGTGGGTTGGASGGGATTGTSGGSATSGSVNGTGATGSVPITGVTDRSITIGFIYTTGRQQATAALGAAGVTSGDELAQWKLIIKVVNDSGGLGGRQIKPVFFGESATSTQSLATQEAAACQAFTEDNHVAAAVSSFQFTLGFVECMNRRGIPTGFSLESLSSSSTFRQYPLQLEPTDMSLDRQGRELGSSLLSKGYFSGAGPLGAVNGILAYDTPAFHDAVNVLTTTLKAKGIAVKDTRYIPFGAATADTSQIATAISGAELAFASEGINHVMVFDINGLLAFLFMTNAQTQGYHPRYGLTSQSSGSHLADLLKGNANAQLKDSLGVGWIPVLDLHANEYGPSQGPPARKACRQLMLKGGQQQGLSSPGAELVATGQCDMLFVLQRAFTHLTGAVSGAAISAALRTVGSGFAPASTFSTSLGTGRHDGVSSVRDMAYNTSCSCFRYTSPLRPAA